MRKLIAILLLVAGLAGCYWLTHGLNPALVTFGPLGPLWLGVFVLLLVALALMPPTARSVDRVIQRLADATPRTRIISALAAAILSPIYLYLTATLTHRQLFPYVHDEFSYLIQARQFAAHRLWMPGHPLGMFFDSFQIFTQPVYASAYFPGTALMYVPGVLLHLRPFVTTLVLAAVMTGLVYWIISELIDSLAGWLAVLLLLGDETCRIESTIVLAHLPVLVFGLCAFACWLNWRKNNRDDWAIGLGFFLALAAVTRPVDALGFAIPVATGVAIRCLRRQSIRAFPAIIGGAVPLIVLQLLLNHGITGKWTQTPFQLYADREYPGSNYGFGGYRESAQAESNVPQIRAMYDSYRPQLAVHQWGNVWHDIESRARMICSQLSPSPYPVLVILLPVSILGLTRLSPDQRGPAIALLIFAPLALLLYLPYFLYLPSYALTAAPAIILGILLGVRGLTDLTTRWKRPLRVGLALLIAGLSLAALPNWWNQPAEQMFQAGLLADANRQLSGLGNQRAVVFFKYDPKRNINEEPVYNTDTAWPDDAPVIRVHDLGALDSQVIEYYAQRQPDRVFYWYDEATRKLSSTAPSR